MYRQQSNRMKFNTDMKTKKEMEITSMELAAHRIVKTGLMLFCLSAGIKVAAAAENDLPHPGDQQQMDREADVHALTTLDQGRQIFRYDTFGDRVFWGDTLKLHQAIPGANLGGVGPGVSPSTALAVGLKVDIEALPYSLRQQLAAGQVDLNAPATTLALLKLNAVVGVTGFFDSQ